MTTAAQTPPLHLEQVLSRADDVASQVLSSMAERTDRERRWPEEGLRAMQQAGLGGLVVPRSAGGLGHGLLALVQVCERLGAECASTAICFGMHCVGAAVISAKATNEQRDQYLHPICEGRHLTTLALSEPGTGSHFYFPQTELHSVAGGFQLKGAKSFVTNGGYADSYVLSTVAADAHASPGQFSCVVLPEGSPGMQWSGDWTGLGMRGNSARTLVLDNAFVPRSNLLGKEGDQIWYVFQVVAPYFLMAMSGTYLGIASAALKEATEHLTKRRYRHGGSAPSESAVVQRELGILWRKVERTRRLIYFAAAEGDSGGPNALAALCAAKADVAECAVETVNSAMTLVGGIGYRENSRLDRMMRDARASHVMAPTTFILETWAGRAALGLPLLTE